MLPRLGSKAALSTSLAVRKLQEIQLPSASTPLASQRVLHFASRRLSQPRYNVALGVQGDADARVSEHLAHYHRVDALSEEKLGAGLSRLVATSRLLA